MPAPGQAGTLSKSGDPLLQHIAIKEQIEEPVDRAPRPKAGPA